MGNQETTNNEETKANKLAEFYSHKMEELQTTAGQLAQEGGNLATMTREEQDIEEVAQQAKEDASLEILVDLAKQGDLNPWDVDLEMVTSKYLQAIKDNPIDCLKEAGRAIFYASVLLRMKSDLLMAQSNEALNIGVHKELDDAYLLEEELNDKPITQITFNDLEAALRRKYIQKAKRFRKLSLKDLISALQDAKEEEENRIYRKQQRLFDLEAYNIIAPELSGDIMELTHAENLEDAIKRLRMVLPEHLFDGNMMNFSEIVQILGCWSNAFLAVLFIAHEGEIEFKQDEFYGELWIHEPKDNN